MIESLIADLMIRDMKSSMDVSQYGNQRGVSIQHYLIKMVHSILQSLDSNNTKEVFAVVANMIDRSSAFPRQCPKLGVQSFIDNNVRGPLIPILISYFQNRKMTVKFNGVKSTVRNINGGGPQGATLGILEYLSQSNNNADCVKPEDRYKFVDDLTILEVINILTVGITSYNFKNHIPTDIPTHNQFIPPENLNLNKTLTK